MPVQSCQSEGKPGYKWGDSGACYTYTPGDESSMSRARSRAERQGRAARAGGYQGMNKQEDWLGKPLYDELTEDEKYLADALLHIANNYGPLDREDSEIWVGYQSTSENENASIGVKCENCALVASENACAIIAQEIEPEGLCRLAVIPPGYVSEREEDETMTRTWGGFFLPVISNG